LVQHRIASHFRTAGQAQTCPLYETIRRYASKSATPDASPKKLAKQANPAGLLASTRLPRDSPPGARGKFVAAAKEIAARFDFQRHGAAAVARHVLISLPSRSCTGGRAALEDNVYDGAMTVAYDFNVKTIDGTESKLDKYRGKALLIVNVASECGFTPQYSGLEALYKRLGPRGLEVLGFPCDQFGHQEPGDEKQILEFCTARFGVSFPLFAKIKVNGAETEPLYAWLKNSAKGLLGTQAIKWNFTKFLVDRSGQVVRRYAPNTTPEKLEPAIQALL
jgi:glutathione peroxidase